MYEQNPNEIITESIAGFKRTHQKIDFFARPTRIENHGQAAVNTKTANVQNEKVADSSARTTKSAAHPNKEHKEERGEKGSMKSRNFKSTITGFGGCRISHSDKAGPPSRECNPDGEQMPNPNHQLIGADRRDSEIREITNWTSTSKETDNRCTNIEQQIQTSDWPIAIETNWSGITSENDRTDLEVVIERTAIRQPVLINLNGASRAESGESDGNPRVAMRDRKSEATNADGRGGGGGGT